MNDLSWVTISTKALKANISQFKRLVGDEVLLCPCVKANAYGHGLQGTARAFLEAGADWLAVNALYEARVLREAGILSPICVIGYVPLADLQQVLDLDLRLVVYNKEIVLKLGEVAGKAGKKVRLHVKVETGNNRQGVLLEDLKDFAALFRDNEFLQLEGMSTHFANIEDTTNHSYAKLQLEKFREAERIMEKMGFDVPIKHCANSAATILFPETHYNMVRIGIAAYGMWPSRETFVSAGAERAGFVLEPAFSWKTKIAQIKDVPKDSFIGYGCTYKTNHNSKLAILPIGYYDGYDRGISGAYVLIHGKRAPVRGRVCMNIIMVDVTDIPEAKTEDEAVLIGRDRDEEISAEQFASWIGTINYEVTTRVNERIPRIFN